MLKPILSVISSLQCGGSLLYTSSYEIRCIDTYADNDRNIYLDWVRSVCSEQGVGNMFKAVVVIMGHEI